MDRTVDFELLKIANSQFKTIAIERRDKNGNITSKPYVEVNERVKAFRFIYPRGSIRTEQKYLIGDEPNRIVSYRCEIFDDDGNYLADGEAEEKENSSFINKTSFIENCQTSAIGRALGFVGLGIDGGIASYEEVANAQANQVEEKKVNATEKQVKLIKELYSEEMQETIKDYYKVNSLEDLNVQQASQVIAKAKNREKEKADE